MIEGILAEWFSKLDKTLQTAYFTNGVAHANMETLRAQMTHLYQALRDEGVHVFHCRRVINRMLYGVPEPEGVSTLFDHVRNVRMEGLDDSTFTLTGTLDPKAATALIGELAKAGAVVDTKTEYGE